MGKKAVKQPPRRGRIWIFLIKLGFTLGVLLLAYTLFLDAKVQKRFEGQKWQLPIQVFARPLELYPGLMLKPQELTQMLDLLGYRRTQQIKSAGEYSYASGTVNIYRRPFLFADGPEPARKLRLQFARGQLDDLSDDQGTLAFARLEALQIGRLSTANNEDREIIPLQKVPEQIVDALLLVEDRDFYHHHGVAPLSIARALWQNIQAGRTVQGGSTLTQQLAKNLFLTRERTLIRKFNEAIYALILDYRYSKDQLLEAYLNQVYLGQQKSNAIHGFGLAARYYFAKPVAELAAHEYALLIGMVKGPSYYNPERQPERAQQRRDIVLRLMFESNLLSRQDYEFAVGQDITIKKGERASKGRYPAYLDMVRREIRHLVPGDRSSQGFRVYTGLQPLLQERMEDAIEQRLPALESQVGVKDLQAAMVGAEIETSTLTALVGGRRTHYQGFNRALDARRQIGSVIKPAVYLSALEQYERYTLATKLDDKPLTLTSQNGTTWSPQNYDESFRGEVSLLDGLVKSLNVPTVNLGMQLGVDKVRQLAISLGADAEQLPRYPSLFLGAAAMSPLQVTQMYHTIANQGAYRELHAVEKITDVQGNLMWQFYQDDEPRLSSQAAYLIDYALQQVTRNGSAKSLSWRFPDNQFSGKTGTTNDRRDSWFIGFDNTAIITSWIGRDDNKPAKLTGASGALTLFSEVQKHRQAHDRYMAMPDGIAMTNFSVQTGRPLRGDCVDVTEMPAIQRRLPEPQICTEEQKNWWQSLFGKESSE